jgi:PIN domain nuclease of toxin-antitoxin system
VNILLDTCCIIWAISDPERLPPEIADCLTHKGARISVSAISCGEIACLAGRKKISLDTHWKTWFNTHVEENGWAVLDVDLATIQEAYSLPGEFHNDPADRMITAAARLGSLTVFTADSKILNYPHVASQWGVNKQ